MICNLVDFSSFYLWFVTTVLTGLHVFVFFFNNWISRKLTFKVKDQYYITANNFNTVHSVSSGMNWSYLLTFWGLVKMLSNLIFRIGGKNVVLQWFLQNSAFHLQQSSWTRYWLKLYYWSWLCNRIYVFLFCQPCKSSKTKIIFLSTCSYIVPIDFKFACRIKLILPHLFLWVINSNAILHNSRLW